MIQIHIMDANDAHGLNFRQEFSTARKRAEAAMAQQDALVKAESSVVKADVTEFLYEADIDPTPDDERDYR